METAYQAIVRVGVDVAHTVLQVHAVYAPGHVLAARKLPRTDFFQWCDQLPRGCMVAMEACGTTHVLARRLETEGLQPRLISPSIVVPYRISGKGAKNDANDAAAICEAASRPHMRFVPVKTSEQQAMLAVHRLREGFIEERTACTNRTRSLLAEAGVFERARGSTFRSAIPRIVQDEELIQNEVLRTALRHSSAHLDDIETRIGWCDEQIAVHARANPAAQMAMTVRGVGSVTASAVVASVGDFTQFRNGRQFSAWLGLVPSQHSSGSTFRLGRITKHGNKYLRKLFVMGGRSVLFRATGRSDQFSLWATQVRQRVGWNKAQVAVANKSARLLWRAETAVQVSASQAADGEGPLRKQMHESERPRNLSSSSAWSDANPTGTHI